MKTSLLLAGACALGIALATPATAVVVFESDEVISSKNPCACVVARRVSVYLLMQGPTVERQAEDGELLHAIWVALHGLEIDGYDEQTNEAWSVVLSGVARVLSHDDELDAAETLPLFPWNLAPKNRFVAIEPTEMSGRRFIAEGRK